MEKRSFLHGNLLLFTFFPVILFLWIFYSFAELKKKNINRHELEIEKQELELKNLDREFQQRLQDQRNRYLNLKVFRKDSPILHLIVVQRDLLLKLTRLQQREIKMQV